MSEIKSAEERIHPMALDDKSVWCNAYFDEVAELRAAYEALQKENADLQSRYSALHQQKKELRSEINLIYEPEIKNLQEANAAQVKRIAEHLDLIEATAEFSKAFWEKADNHRDTRVMVSTFQQLERKLRTYLPASKNGE